VGICSFYSEEEWGIIERKYGFLKFLQTPGRA